MKIKLPSRKLDPINTVHHGDCLEIMPKLPEGIYDMILCDLPYGTTACKWDTIIPFVPMWENYWRLLKEEGVIVLTASQPFTSVLVCSSINKFKYEWIWEKDGGSNFATVKYMPMKEHESILIFGKGKIKYNEQREERIGSRKGKITTTVDSGRKDSVYGTQEAGGTFEVPVTRCPRSIQRFTRERGLHPTQKPVALFEYLIKTYTNEGDLVLDNCAGSGTTGVACLNTGRNFTLIEKDKKYFDLIVDRLNDL